MSYDFYDQFDGYDFEFMCPTCDYSGFKKGPGRFTCPVCGCKFEVSTRVAYYLEDIIEKGDPNAELADDVDYLHDVCAESD